MAKKTNRRSTGISPAGKAAILLIIFGIPCLFLASSWGLSKLFELAPMYLVLILTVFATMYTAYTSKLMYDFYEVQAPILRFIPCVCETTLIDIKYHIPCYVCYTIAIIFAAASQLPYSVLKIFGEDFALSAGFYFTVAAIVVLGVIQIIKGIGLLETLHDIGEEWHNQTHADLGAISKLGFFGFIPFVRVISLYSLNKPLSTMVSFMGVNADDVDTGDSFEAEGE